MISNICIALNQATVRLSIIGVIALSGGLCACGASNDAAQETETITPSITVGSLATGFPEAVLVDAYMGENRVACSGTLISPNVVLTSAVCLYRFGPWQVTAPFAGKQSVMAKAGAVFDWSPTNANAHNIGVIFLPSPINLPKYPALANAPVPDGTSVLRIGRSKDAQISSDALFVSEPLEILDGAGSGRPFEYVGCGTFEFGDQGGGVQLPDHTLVAVNNAGSEDILPMTRVDLVVDWLRQQIASVSADTNDAPPPTPTDTNDTPDANWVDLSNDPNACQDRSGVPCGWSATNNGAGYTCESRHPTWAQPWTCEPANWVDMRIDPNACQDRSGVPCGWSATDNGAGYTCENRHPTWAQPWTCEAG